LNKKAMQLLDKVRSSSNICSIELSFDSVSVPSIIAGWQPFYNSIFENNDFKKAYASLSSIDFQEESQESIAGVSYEQKVSFRFPSTDLHRAERIALLQKIKFVKLKLTNGLDIIVGRNDFNQNTKPKVKVKMNQKVCEVNIESHSIFPSGYMPNLNAYGLPAFIPVTLN
jgi:hypothetical protein